MTSRVVLAAGLWLALLGAIGYHSYAFETAPGAASPAPEHWPAGSAFAPARDRATLVMFAHPECPCTAASLAELTEIIAALAAPPRVIVAFTGDRDPTTSTNWQAAGRIPGALRVHDAGGEARLFGARTSGHVAVYDAGGTRRFTGGVTGSRGHVGDNIGRHAVLAALRGQPGETHHLVFGCSLEASP